MTLLRERGRSDDNDARAFLLSNTAEERVELLWDRRGVDLISDALPFGRLWYGSPNAISTAIDYAKHRGRSHDAVIRVYDSAGNVIETHEHARASSKRGKQLTAPFE
jgi:hypothetical protein